MEMSRERFKKVFPHLFEEMETDEQEVAITPVGSDLGNEKKTPLTKFCGYSPDVVDFIRRCDNAKQAEEIIQYLEKREEINSEYARKLRKRLREEGVRSFGPKKEDDYYSKQGENQSSP